MNLADRAAQVIERQAPTWLDANDALGSAVKHVAALSPTFNWVGIYVLNGDMLELGPYIGAATEHTRIKVGRRRVRHGGRAE